MLHGVCIEWRVTGAAVAAKRARRGLPVKGEARAADLWATGGAGEGRLYEGHHSGDGGAIGEQLLLKDANAQSGVARLEKAALRPGNELL